MIGLGALVGLAFLVVALVGGAIATISNIRRARGPLERAFVIRISLMGWGLVIAMMAAMVLLPSPYHYAAVAVYFVLCPILVYRWATTHQLIRVLEERKQPDESDPR